jgi:1-phosphofructokinase family hexose kinase
MTIATYDLLVVGANPAIDRYYCLDDLRIGEVNRVSLVRAAAGGKANNLARVFRDLGGNPLTTGIAAGQTGRQILDYLTAEGIGHDYVFAEGESRQTVTLSAKCQTTVLLEPGPLVSEEIIASLVAKVGALAQPAVAIAITGSLPAGAPAETVGRLVAATRGTSDAMVAVDTSGEALRLAVKAGPHVIKVNCQEYERAFGQPTDRLEDVEAHFEALTTHGVETLCLTDGPRGALVLNRNDRFAVRTLAPDPLSTAGAGDAFLAGFLMTLLRGGTLQDAARFASAAGAAALRHVAAGFVEPADVDSALACTGLLEADAFTGARR